MESTTLEIMIWPVSLTTFATVAACWAVSTVAGWARRLISAASRFDDEADDRQEPGSGAWDPAWAQPDESSSDSSRPFPGRTQHPHPRGRLGG